MHSSFRYYNTIFKNLKCFQFLKMVQILILFVVFIFFTKIEFSFLDFVFFYIIIARERTNRGRQHEHGIKLQRLSVICVFVSFVRLAAWSGTHTHSMIYLNFIFVLIFISFCGLKLNFLIAQLSAIIIGLLFR